MNRFHAPGKEKRMIVIVPRAEWDDWLTCRDPEVARSFLRGAGLENPWLAGTVLEYHPGPAALVAAVAGALRVAPTLAAAILSIWCVVLVPLLLYLLAAPLWKEWRRTLLASVLGLVGWNVWGGLGLGSGEPQTAVALAATLLTSSISLAARSRAVALRQNSIASL